MIRLWNPRTLIVFVFLMALAGALAAHIIATARAAPIAQVADPDPAIADAAPPPAAHFQPTRRARFKAWLHERAENTGGGFLAFGLVLLIDRARRKWPTLDDGEGWDDEVIGTAMAALTWVGTSLATGATWGTTGTGLVAAAATGGLMSLRPRRVKRQLDKERAAADCAAATA